MEFAVDSEVESAEWAQLVEQASEEWAMRQAKLSIEQAAARVRADPDAAPAMVANLPPAPAAKLSVSWTGWLIKEGERNIIGWPTRQRRFTVLDDDNMLFYERVEQDGTPRGYTTTVVLSGVSELRCGRKSSRANPLLAHFAFGFALATMLLPCCSGQQLGELLSCARPRPPVHPLTRVALLS